MEGSGIHRRERDAPTKSSNSSAARSAVAKSPNSSSPEGIVAYCAFLSLGIVAPITGGDPNAPKSILILPFGVLIWPPPLILAVGRPRRRLYNSSKTFLTLSSAFCFPSFDVSPPIKRLHRFCYSLSSPANREIALFARAYTGMSDIATKWRIRTDGIRPMNCARF
jgi:hypothetical protein